MIKNYLKVAFRSLWRSKLHSLINVSGLALGIACCLLIILYVKDEFSFDRFHSKAERIYRAYVSENIGGETSISTSTPFPLGPALRDHLPEVESVVRLSEMRTQVKAQDQLFSETVALAGTDFLQVFDFEVVRGVRETALSKQSNVVLTESSAKRLFGDADPIGKMLSIQVKERFEDFTVTAVLKEQPENSTIRFSTMITDLNYSLLYDERKLTSAWFNTSPETYVLLREGVDVQKLEEKFPSVFKPLVGERFEESQYRVGLQPLTSIYLDPSLPENIPTISNPKYSYILGAIALLILIVACINFVTLSIGRSFQRAKEVGVRKVAGAQRRQIMFQFVGEAVIITCISLVVGLCIAFVSVPLFNSLSGKQLTLTPDGLLMVVAFFMIVVIGLCAGSYPAFVLSAFRPISVLKGAVQAGSSKQNMRKLLVGFQLVLSIFLISSTLLMKKQLDFLRSKNLGFDREQLAVIQLNVPGAPGGGRLKERIPRGFEMAIPFKAELSKISQIASVCASSHDFGNGSWVNLGYTDEEGTYRSFSYNAVDEQFLPTMHIELVAGRNFSAENLSDVTRGVIINQAFANEYGWTDPIGKRIPGKKFPDHEVIGVVKDFNYASLYTRVQPLVMTMNPLVGLAGAEDISVDSSPVPKLIIRLRPGNATATLDQIKGVWDKLTGGEEFSFSFVDAALDEQYKSDRNLGKVVSLATLLAMVIGSLGLYGLASLAMQNRTKEISIRKVLGATVHSLLVLLSKDYVYLILISLLLSVPFTLYLVSMWLSTFEYRIAIGVDVFFTAGGISLLIALLTISYQAVKTSWSQPAETLKNE